MLYKAGGVEEIHGGLFTTLIIDEATPGELERALKEGWALTTQEALKPQDNEVKKARKSTPKVDETVTVDESMVVLQPKPEV